MNGVAQCLGIIAQCLDTVLVIDSARYCTVLAGICAGADSPRGRGSVPANGVRARRGLGAVCGRAAERHLARARERECVGE